MADFGAVGFSQLGGEAPVSSPIFFKSLLIAGQYHVKGKRSDSEGFPIAPSLRMDARGYHSFLWRVAAGTRTMSVHVKQEVNLNPRPTLRILANPLIGVTEQVGTAAGSAGWVKIGPLTINPTVAGVVKVVMEANYDGQDVPSYWDNIDPT